MVGGNVIFAAALAAVASSDLLRRITVLVVRQRHVKTAAFLGNDGKYCLYYSSIHEYAKIGYE